MWANSLPEAQGLYNPENERDSCGVGFIVSIKGEASYEILSDASTVLCNMTHRGAEGADARDGDGAGVMTAIPDELFRRQIQNLPPAGEYACGNVYLHPDVKIRQETKLKFEELAGIYGLRVLAWRAVPRDNSMIGPVSKSKEPVIEQPFVIKETNINKDFNLLIYLLRKHASNSIAQWFYICSLNTSTIVYKGQLSPCQVYEYYLDLTNKSYKTHFTLVHSRFSTNTFPSWNRAQPMRLCAHNGEINTLRGNKNWMRAREGGMKSDKFNVEDLFPIIEEFGSDSAAFDNCLELLVANGELTLPESVILMLPEAWQHEREHMSKEKQAFFEWASCVMEPWDGPALILFADGRFVGACLDRNGLRPCRYYLTDDDRLVCASEVGVINRLKHGEVIERGRLRPSELLVVDCQEQRIIHDKEFKENLFRKFQFQDFTKGIFRVQRKKSETGVGSSTNITKRQTITVGDPRVLIKCGVTSEELNVLILPMARDGKEALGSMGTDVPLACLSDGPRSVYDYFKQVFAQVTNPPIDPLREHCVMSIESYCGPEGNLLSVNGGQCRHRIHLKSPLISSAEMEGIKEGKRCLSIDLTFEDVSIDGYLKHLAKVETSVLSHIESGYEVFLLTDQRLRERNRSALSTLIAVGAVHQLLLNRRLRNRVAIIAATGEARQVHHFCCLMGFGADAVQPWLIEDLLSQDSNLMFDCYIKAVNNGILKVMSKMGISTLQSYKSAQIFEIIGLHQSVVDRCFNGSQSRLSGCRLEELAADALTLYQLSQQSGPLLIPDWGELHWRLGGSTHVNTPETISTLQQAVRSNSHQQYKEYSANVQQQLSKCTLRGLLEFVDTKKPIPLSQVEPWQSIVKRFATGAMSFGSVSQETHLTIAKAMNELHGKSNTGEGGDVNRLLPQTADTDSGTRASIKQVASGRFGVDCEYLVDADDIQIKMAQGAKPGEGGELPGHKVTDSIARTRNSMAGVGLISPPPHHDIYSIEDLKQLIHDLQSANQKARISVKLVSCQGVGVVSAGVVKAKARHILVSGHDGGTGASRWTGIKHAGIPWELGLAECQQTLRLNGLRSRVVLQTDGQLKTGRDVAVACLLGAEEFAFATTPLITLGCLMMRKCHLNTCPVGIATQDPELRQKFRGQPEHLIRFFYFIAEELREIMANLGIRTIDEMVGRVDLLKVREDLTGKRKLLDLSPLLKHVPDRSTDATLVEDDHYDNLLINKLNDKDPQVLIKNVHRSVGSRLSSFLITTRNKNNYTFKFTGHAGQSFGAFLIQQLEFQLDGDSNDYVGKGLSGGRIIIFNSHSMTNRDVLVGNVCLYGATRGQLFVRGQAAERFCVRNSGADAVVEGVGDHACEYMTGGLLICLGPHGKNFGAGMSGGLAFLLRSEFTEKYINSEMVDVDAVEIDDLQLLREFIQKHYLYTKSPKAQELLHHTNLSSAFVKIYPKDLKKIKRKSIEPVKKAIVDLEDLDKLKGFVKYERQSDAYRPAEQRVKDWNEITQRLSDQQVRKQTSRCMDCGVAFCQSACPIGNLIPKWNELVFDHQWRTALDRLLQTNNFPEFTGRVCPAPCEGSCVVAVNPEDAPVAIKSIECAIIDKGFQKGWIQPRIPENRLPYRIAIVGSGPCGLAAADQLNQCGYHVTVFERSDRIGGLLAVGIPNMKLDKSVVERRVDLMRSEGIEFKSGVNVGASSTVAGDLLRTNDAILLAIGSTRPRDLNIPNRSLQNIYFAMDYLQQKDFRNSAISAKGKQVIVIGGGDTGCDCIGTAMRQGAKSIVNFELLPEPPKQRSADNPWPQYPKTFKVDYGHAEVKAVHGKDPRHYRVLSKNFVSDGNGNVAGIETVQVQWERVDGRWQMSELPGTERLYPADMVLLSMGFVGPEESLLSQFDVALTKQKLIDTKRFQTSIPGVFAAGDCRRGQSLVVWAINEGRLAAREIDDYLQKSPKRRTLLPVTGGLVQIENVLQIR